MCVFVVGDDPFHPIAIRTLNLEPAECLLATNTVPSGVLWQATLLFLLWAVGGAIKECSSEHEIVQSFALSNVTFVTGKEFITASLVL
jgi:hypothetical protein